MKEKTQIYFFKSFEKLKANSFTAVRWLDRRNVFKIGSVIEGLFHNPVVHRSYTKGYFRIIRIDHVKMATLSDDFIKLESECDREQFYYNMVKWYSRKPNWLGWDSTIQVLYLERVRGSFKQPEGSAERFSKNKEIIDTMLHKQGTAQATLRTFRE